MRRWTLGTIERRCGVTVLVKPLPESPFLDPDSGVAVFSGAVARKPRVLFWPGFRK